MLSALPGNIKSRRHRAARITGNPQIATPSFSNHHNKQSAKHNENPLAVTPGFSAIYSIGTV